MAELVGGAILNGFINVLFERMATPEFMDLFVTHKMDRKLLQKLNTYLTTVNAVLYDVEYRQTALKDASVKYFLEEVRDVAYEADDLLDLIAYKVTAAEIKADQRAKRGDLPWNLSSLFKLLGKINQSKQVSMPSSVTKKIEEIVEILDILVKQIDPLGLKKNHRKDALPQREPTTSMVEESEIFGRKEDEDALFKSLEATDSNDIGVIPIVGMGGIGKTTLARLVYNSSKTKELFVTRAWVCVSDNYDGFRIKKELLQQVNTSAKCDKLSPQQIDEELKKSLAKQKYLIVLDDIWEIGYDNWNQLLKPLKSGAPESKIIVTTRIKDTARLVRAGDEHCLRTLNEDSCWKLFEKHAFVNGKGDEILQSFKEDILGKCEGLPLAAKMLGGLLRGKQEKAECGAILKSKFWELDCEVTPALMLSYQYLPSHLKHCFAYCAIFPKDYKITKEEIVQLWMAECFVVKPEGGGENIVDLGKRHFQELVSRSFFQEHKDEIDGSYFLMHDLIHDLAEKISGEFLVRMDEDNICKFRRRHRYFSFMNSTKNISTMFGSFQKAQFLRIFWSFGWQRYHDYEDRQKIVDEVVNHLRCLRVLSLRIFDVVKLPHSIKHLKHLRYLNLSHTGIKKLSNSVCSLYYLQTLNLYECVSLVELPKDIEKLINLHSLDIRETWSLEKIPSELGNLKNLFFLSNFVVGKQKGAGMDELGKLQHLRGELCISNLQNVVETPEYILKNKKHLETLKLEWSRKKIEGSEHDVRVLERLQPSESINKLSIIGFRGKNLPDWVTNSSYTNIVSLKLDGCHYCTLLPEFYRLSSLEHLLISNCSAVTKISMTKPFKSLKTLLIQHMLQWKDWCFCEENDSEKCPLEVFPVLKSLHLEYCDDLKSLSAYGKPFPQNLRCLASLGISYCKSLICFPKRGISAPNMSSLELYFCRSLESLPEGMNVLLSSLKHLKISYCWQLESFPEGGFPATLQSLKIFHCNNKLIEWCWKGGSQTLHALSSLQLAKYGGDHLNCFPFPLALTVLEMDSFLNLKFMNCKDLQHLTHLYVSNCPNLESFLQGLPSSTSVVDSESDESVVETQSFQHGGLLPKLQSLVIDECDKLIGRRLLWGLQRFNALTHLILRNYKGDDLDFFPEKSLLPSTLISLTIKGFQNLKVINYKSLRRLTSLSKLEFYKCDNLRLSKEELPSSLSVIED